MLEVIDIVNRVARGLGFLLIGAFVGWFLIAAIESTARACHQRRQQRKARERRMGDPWDDEP
jgi:uncharacterized integral membrane protein